ncbi:MAG: cupin domain-containing protein [Candidatus Pacebacteria bacterium]|nr:cupin domain-containing protein [Candidatus Paceibacterota bacterium]
MIKTVIGVKKLPLTSNVCKQAVREVINLNRASVAHVEVQPGDASLLHRHKIFTQLYYILEGRGRMYVGGRGDFPVAKDTLIWIAPGRPHKLENTGRKILSHLVISIPPFSQTDVEVIDEQ